MTANVSAVVGFQFPFPSQEQQLNLTITTTPVVCEVPSGLQTCNMVDYPIADWQNAKNNDGLIAFALMISGATGDWYVTPQNSNFFGATDVSCTEKIGILRSYIPVTN